MTRVPETFFEIFSAGGQPVLVSHVDAAGRSLCHTHDPAVAGGA